MVEGVMGNISVMATELGLYRLRAIETPDVPILSMSKHEWSWPMAGFAPYPQQSMYVVRTS